MRFFILFQILILFTFAAFCQLPSVKDSVVFDTVIVNKPPVELTKTVYLPYESRQSGNFFLQAGYEWNHWNKTSLNVIKDSTEFLITQNPPAGNFTFEGGYFSRIFRYRIGLSFKNLSVDLNSITRSSDTKTSYFTVKDTLDCYYVFEDGKKVWKCIIEDRRDSVSYKKEYSNHRNNQLQYRLVEIPVAISVPLNFRKFVFLPEIGFSAFYISKVSSTGNDYQGFQRVSSDTKFYISPSASLSIGYEVLKKVYLSARANYKMNISSQNSAPMIHRGGVAGGILISYLF